MKGFFEHIGNVLILLARTVYWCKDAWKNVTMILKQMLEVGVNTLPVASLVSFCMGMVFALHTGRGLAKFGWEEAIAPLVGVSMARELSPLMIGIVATARVGASAAAELGTMKVSEEIDALKTMAINPIRYLVMPKFLACIIMVPILTVYANFTGMFGGLLVGKNLFGISARVYIRDMMNFLTLRDIFSGIIKAVAFGIIIAIVACYQGMNTTGGAEGVGKATTRAVVISMVCIFIFNYLLAWILY